MANIHEMLERLSEYEEQIIQVAAPIIAKRAAIQTELDEVNELLLSTCPELRIRATELTTQILATVREIGTTVKGSGYTVKYRKGYIRVSYDRKGLDGYMVAHPEISAFRKESQVAPSVKIVKEE